MLVRRNPSLAGANLMKSTAGDVTSFACVKGDAESRYTLGVAYPHNKADVSTAQDGHRDFVSADVLEKTAWEYMLKSRKVNMFHKAGTDGHATVVESYVYRGPDWDIGNGTVVKAGDWMIGCIWDEYGWALVKAGLINGYSPEGGARRTKPTADQLAQLRQNGA